MTNRILEFPGYTPPALVPKKQGLPIYVKCMHPNPLIGPKHAEFAMESWDLWGIPCVAELMFSPAGRPVFDENQAFKSKNRSAPAERAGGNDVG
jgi:hypothetical protein